MVCPSCGARNDDAAEVCFTCRAVLSVLTRGSVVGDRYEILAPLGRGGMGSVYKARDRTLDELVALKVLRPEVARSPEMAERFRSEIRLARRVSQRNVCRIHDYGDEQGTAYIAMEWIEGRSLKEAIRERGGLPEKQCLAVALQIAEGLRAIHAAGIVHRDLTTPNIMLGADGLVRILDFGIAKRVNPNGATHPTAAGYVMGSPEYMSPEQARGRPVDYRTDIYSFGVVLFELATGTVPFRADTPVATLLLHIDAPPPLGTASIPRALAPVLSRALAKDPKDRYSTTAELIDALRSAGEGAASRAASSPPSRTDTAEVSRRALGLAAIALGLGLTVGMALLTVRGNREPAARPTRDDGPPARSSASAARPPSEAPPARASSTPAETDRRPRSPAPEPVPRTTSPSPSPSPPAASREPTDAETRAASAPPGLSGTPIAATPAPTPEVVASPSPFQTASAPGALLVLVTPWADVAIDGVAVGQTPLTRIPLSPGPHTVVLTHPDYQPFPRRVVIRPGETLRLTVALAIEGVRQRR